MTKFGKQIEKYYDKRISFKGGPRVPHRLLKETHEEKLVKTEEIEEDNMNDWLDDFNYVGSRHHY